ncbi:succinate CoA transferase [Marinococcus luteus]|uniref:succinate CoA transferase n=1 Tax=Marinococcus luteus TaxID=1122204 RepID=UPI002ACC50A6|nr:succinate CoA transferase [Marinococcus luteus]MDZ5784034.1 succinate CoA transferase [Marinococcus luteus]
MNNDLHQVLRYNDLKKRIMDSETAAGWIKNGMTVGLSGFTRAGDVKAMPGALVEKAKHEEFCLDVYTGASLGSDTDQIMADAGIVCKRLPFQVDQRMREEVNRGNISFIDQHLSHTAEGVRDGSLNRIDAAIIEAVAITEEGWIVPSTSVGNSAVFAEEADMIIVELNTAQPAELEGMHDIYHMVRQGERGPIPLRDVEDRIGTTAIRVDPEKIQGIIITNELDSPSTVTSPDETTKAMAGHLIDFLKEEYGHGNAEKELPPLQSGIGTVANAVFHGLLDSEFTNLEVYSEVLQDAVFDLMDAGKVRFASGCSITLSGEKMDEVFPKLEDYREQLVLRPQELSNHPEIIRRLGLISINTALEADIYGNVNSTHVNGTNMMNGIGGSGDFARNARTAIFVTKSIAKNGDISSIVPFVSHVDHTEHDVDILVTEQGYADLRGLAPRERVAEIIQHCAHPLYQEQLWSYFQRACKEAGGQTPHLLEEAFSWHIQMQKEGTMREAAVKI